MSITKLKYSEVPILVKSRNVLMALMSAAIQAFLVRILNVPLRPCNSDVSFLYSLIFFYKTDIKFFSQKKFIAMTSTLDGWLF